MNNFFLFFNIIINVWNHQALKVYPQNIHIESDKKFSLLKLSLMASDQAEEDYRLVHNDV